MVNPYSFETVSLLLLSLSRRIRQPNPMGFVSAQSLFEVSLMWVSLVWVTRWFVVRNASCNIFMRTSVVNTNQGVRCAVLALSKYLLSLVEKSGGWYMTMTWSAWEEALFSFWKREVVWGIFLNVPAQPNLIKSLRAVVNRHRQKHSYSQQ